LDVKSRPFVQQLAAPPTVSLPEKWLGLLKELRHTVKQKNPNTDKRIEIPAKNKSRSRLQADTIRTREATFPDGIVLLRRLFRWWLSLTTG
jgi:hypothetical protein